MSNYGVYMNINAAVVAQAEVDVPMSGYDTSKMYLAPEYSGLTGDNELATADNAESTADESNINPADKMKGYLVGDGTAPNGLPCGTGIEFDTNPSKGDYFLRTDYLPNRLFRFDGRRWVTVEEKIRANVTPGSTSGTLRNSFVNNTNTFTNVEGDTLDERQSLSKVFKLRADN
jgi:hypothetical protein